MLQNCVGICVKDTRHPNSDCHCRFTHWHYRQQMFDLTSRFSKSLPISWHFRPDACLPPPKDTDLRKSLPLLNFLKHFHSPLVFFVWIWLFVCLFVLLLFLYKKKKRKTLNFIFRKRKKMMKHFLAYKNWLSLLKQTMCDKTRWTNTAAGNTDSAMCEFAVFAWGGYDLQSPTISLIFVVERKWTNQ